MSIASGIYYIRSYDNDRFTLFPTYNRDQIVNVADKHSTDENAKVRSPWPSRGLYSKLILTVCFE